ncbi:polysaccharide pyruvyl transferase family protein [Celeribacter litoreus]|uniref:polysaccharide pyruvyl transferase family protein n=1 Tax=Celeribacter litoreus TaxID=2876714 RepID=UPI001CCDBD5F|nr:polysaccharide pyruvyl transferase family protein [Celeribacter litoreus]MCA0044243.1 polysaccharide pyruvyl transferase family protein [Celeribacter litoreus]
MYRKWSSADVSRFLGGFRACFLTHSRNKAIRSGAASGGTTSQLLIELLEAKIIDGAIVWKMGTRDGRPYAEPIIAQTREEVISARTSRYVPAYFARDAMPLIQDYDGKLAIVALPCDVTYLRRRMSKDAALAKKIVGILALFCGHNSLPELTEITCARHGFSWADLDDFTYRTGSWRGTLTMLPKNGSAVQIPTRQFTHFQNLHYFSEKKCLSCFDHFGYDADISLGDSWTMGEKRGDVKPTICVVRTAVGEHLFDVARQGLEWYSVRPEHVLSGNSRGMLYHYNVSARSAAARGLNYSINDRLHVPISFLDKLIARWGVSNVLWTTRDLSAKEALTKKPFWKIKAQVYFFKALQELNSYRSNFYGDNCMISIIGATLTGNQGAAAMLETTIGEVSKRFPDAQFIIHSYFPDEDRKACSSPNIKVVDARPKALVLSALPALLDRCFRWLGFRVPNFLMPQSLREIRSSAVLLDISGISLADGREKFLPFNLLCNWPAMLVGTPVVKLAQAMGPMESFATRSVARFLFRHVHHVFARGKTTRKHISVHAPIDKTTVAADIAFLYREDYALIPDWSEKLDCLIEKLSIDERPTIAISVSSVVAGILAKSGKSYIDAMADLVEQLNRDGYRIVVFPNACRTGTSSTRNNDIPIIEGLREKLSVDLSDVHLVTHVVNTAAIRRLLTRADALISSRFHAMVAALSLGTPTLVLGWSHKYEEVMEMFGGESRFIGTDNMSYDAISEAVAELLEHRDAIKTTYAKHCREVEKLSSSQFEWLNDFLHAKITTALPNDTA